VTTLFQEPPALMIIERLGAVGQLELHLHLLILFVGIFVDPRKPVCPYKLSTPLIDG
jgi:hypothetical protein